MELKGKAALVTGGSDGLGFSIAKALVAKGVQTHILSRSQKNLDVAAKRMDSPLLHTHQGDVTDFSSLEAAVKEIGEVDILINNAGIWLEGKVTDNTVEEVDRAIDINLKGVVYAVKAVLPGMLKRDEGYIFNIVSTSGLKGRSNQSVYVASKFGASGFTKSLQVDLAETNIKVAGLYPGGMSTSLFSKSGNPKENEDWMDTDKVAEIVIFMMERDDTLIMDHVVLNKRRTKMSNAT